MESEEMEAKLLELIDKQKELEEQLAAKEEENKQLAESKNQLMEKMLVELKPRLPLSAEEAQNQRVEEAIQILKERNGW